jgi:hypothetical protein
MTEIPADRYNAHPGITKSAICAARIEDGVVSMAHMRAEMLRDRDDANATEAMQRGTLAHAALLEPTALAGRCALWEGEAKRGKAWAEFKADAESAGKIIVTPAVLSRLRAMGEAVRQHSVARGLVGSVERTEVGIEWTDRDYSLAKGRPDAIGRDLLVEYKTSRTICKRWFMSDCRRRGYHLGLAWYWHGLGRPERVYLLNQESADPYSCACYRVDAARILEPAYEEARRIAVQYRICEKMGDGGTGIFAGPYPEMMTFELPAFAGGDWEVGKDDDETEGDMP